MTAPKLATMVLVSNHKISRIYPYIFQTTTSWQHQIFQPVDSKVKNILLFELFMVYLRNLNIHRFIDIFLFINYQANDSNQTSNIDFISKLKSSRNYRYFLIMTAPKQATMVLIRHLKNLRIYLYIFVHHIPSK
jgi:hypothetical protein